VTVASHTSSNLQDAKVQTIRFTSVLPVSYRDELERIVFFNPEQDRVTAPLLNAVRRYGVPSIVEDGGTLRFRVPAFGLIQSLYALDESEPPSRLAGVVMFVRESADTMLLLHLAIHEAYAIGGPFVQAWVTPRLLAAVRRTCLQTRGIRTMRMLYPHPAQIRLESTS
jgi:hypothetical protein